MVIRHTGAGADNESSGLLWADVGKRLGMTPQETLSLQAVFGEMLGLEECKTVPEELVPVIAFISKERLDGTPDHEILGRLANRKSKLTWPEQVLAIMETASALTLPPLPTSMPPPLPLPLPSMPPDVTATSGTLLHDDEPSEASIKEMILDLRREIRSHFARQRADILRLDQGVRKLSLEVRDMRYALMLGFSRRDRKRGKKGISNLLLG